MKPLEDAVRLLCRQDEWYSKQYLSVSKKPSGHPRFPDVCGKTFDLSTIDGCVALGRELGLTMNRLDFGMDVRGKWRVNILSFTIADFQSALAAGIEYLYGKE